MTVDRDALRLRLRGLFLDELDEHVQVLNAGLLRLERGEGAADLVNDLFRSAHSLKGAASAAGISAVEVICHRIEDVLSRVRDGAALVEADFEPLFRAVDTIAAAGVELRAGGDASGVPVAEVTRRLTAAAAATPVPAEPVVEAPGRRGDERGMEPGADLVRAPAEVRQVRVNADRLDALLNHAGEILLASRRVHELVGGIESTGAAVASPGADSGGPAGPVQARLDELRRAAAAADRTLAGAAQALVDEVRLARMLPFASACAGLDRVARDVARAAGKDARVQVEGAEVELDRPVLEALREPLLHLVRNAVDHGIEPPGLRERVGKPAAGHITVNARVEGTTVAVTVADDGAGVDVSALREAAGRRGIDVADHEADEVIDVALAPGVSTAPIITEVSGRGIGLDVVRNRAESLGGSVRISSNTGQGTSIVLYLPLTVSAVRVVFVVAAGEAVGIPSAAVSRVVRCRRQELRLVDGRQVLAIDGRPVPVVRLDAGAEGDPSAGVQRRDAMVEGVQVTTPRGEVLLWVDGLLGEEEVVMKPLGERLGGVAGLLGATILSTGQVAVVLNPATGIRAAAAPPVPATGGHEHHVPRRTRVLLAEDTLTTRVLERSILESAGYDVLVAVDGLEAWNLLQEHGADVVVSDVNMPRMDGLALCEAVRGSSRFRELPFVLVTSLASEEDRRRGVEAGANGYIVKADFEQGALLDVIERLR